MKVYFTVQLVLSSSEAQRKTEKIPAKQGLYADSMDERYGERQKLIVALFSVQSMVLVQILLGSNYEYCRSKYNQCKFLKMHL